MTTRDEIEVLRKREADARAVVDRIRECYQLMGQLQRVLERGARDLGIETIFPSDMTNEIRQIEGVALARWEAARRAVDAAELGAPRA